MYILNSITCSKNTVLQLVALKFTAPTDQYCNVHPQPKFHLRIARNKSSYYGINLTF